MNPVRITETPLIIRTDFSDENAWTRMIAVATEPPEPFHFNMELLCDRSCENVEVDQLVSALPAEYPHPFLVVADHAAISNPDFPLLIVDLLEQPGRRFRALAAHVASIENNLSIGNMGFEEFAESVDASGVFRGFGA